MEGFWAVSERKTLLVALGIIIVVAGAFAPIFGGRFVLDDDATQFYLPAFKFYSEALSKGESFNIVPQVLSGFPFYLSYIGGFYDPLNYTIFKTLPYPFAYYFRIFLNYLLSAVFVFFLCLELRLGYTAALIAALAFLTAQDIQSGLNMVNSNSYFFLPGLFYIAAKLFNLKPFISLRLLFLFLAGIAIFIVGTLGGAAQYNLISSVAILFFIAFLSWGKYRSEGSAAMLQPLLAAFMIFSIGAAIFLPHSLRVLELVNYSDRRGGLSWEKAGGGGSGFGSTIAPSSIYFFFPKTFQIPGVVESGGGGYVPFLGSVALLFFGIFLISSKNKNWYFWAGLFLFSAVSTFPYPLFWLMHKLPVFSLFRNPPIWLLVVSFTMSIMSGIGYEEFIKKKTFSKEVMIIISALLVGLFTSLAFIIYHWPVKALTVLNPVSAIDIFIPLLLWAGTATVFYFYGKNKSLKYLKLFLFIIIIFSFWTPVWTKLFKKSSSFRSSSIFESPGVYKEIRQYEEKSGNKEPFRTFNFYPGDSQWFFFVRPFNPNVQDLADFQKEVVRPNLYHLLDNIESVRGYDNLITRRYKKMLTFIEGNSLKDWVRYNNNGTSFIEVPLQRLRVLGMMNVKYIWSIFTPQPSLFDNNLELVSSGTIVESHPLPFNLFLNKEFIPRVYSPSSISFLNEAEENFEEIILQEHDFKETGFIECKNNCPAGTAISQDPPSIRIGAIHNDSIAFSTEGGKDAWVIISNSFIPRWRAFIDDKETDIYYANYAYQGVKVSAGKHNVVLRYIR